MTHSYSSRREATKTTPLERTLNRYGRIAVITGTLAATAAIGKAHGQTEAQSNPHIITPVQVERQSSPHSDYLYGAGFLAGTLALIAASAYLSKSSNNPNDPSYRLEQEKAKNYTLGRMSGFPE